MTHYTVYLYEREEKSPGHTIFWPAGKYSYPGMLKRAERHLESAVRPDMTDICGMIRTPEMVYSFRNMTLAEAMHVSPVKVSRNS